MEVNKRIGDYEILGELGSGGMGKVFRVRNVISDRIEAMKVLLPDLVGRQDLAARFLREIKVLAALNHPNIAALRTALTADNQLVMIMEYVEGQSLAQRLAHGPIATADATAYIEQILDALAYAHRQHVVHRDVKPANMMLTPAGAVKLTDFGIARAQCDHTLTATNTTTGSLGYMSPEQVHGAATDARSDLYSVGISLYEMVTGQRPFQANSDFAVMLAHLNEQPKPPSELQPALPSELNGIILKSIAKEPVARFQSADEFRQALQSLRGVRSQTASRTATVLAAAPIPVGAAGMGAGTATGSRTPISSTGSDHARTVLDTTAPSAPPLATPRVAAPSTPGIPPARMRSGHPLLFVALGGALVIAALVGTGVYLRRAEAEPDRAGSGRTPAATLLASKQAPAATSTNAARALRAPPSSRERATSAGSTPAPTAEANVPELSTSSASIGSAARAGNQQPTPAFKEQAATGRTRRADIRPRALAADSRTSGSSTAREASRETAPAGTLMPPPAPKQDATSGERAQDTVVLDKLEQEIDQLTARAEAVNNSLDRLHEQQARQGFGLRGDMVARQKSMNLNLSKAQDAVGRRDVGRAQKYRDATESDVEALERFLGR